MKGVKREKGKQTKPGPGQRYLPGSGPEGIQEFGGGGEKKLDARTNAEGGQEEREGFFSFFLGKSALSGKLYYCRVPKSLDSDLLTRLSQLRPSDEKSFAEVLTDAKAKIWILRRNLGARIPNAWSGPFPPDSEPTQAELNRIESGYRVVLVDDYKPFPLPLPGLKDAKRNNLQRPGKKVPGG